jgi:hypothetical protein
MKNYYAVDGKLYTLTFMQKQKMENLFPPESTDGRTQEQEEKHIEQCEWIENNGKYLGPVDSFNY